MKNLKPDAVSVPSDAIPKIRHVMRKLYAIQFRWPVTSSPSQYYGAELAVLHRTLAAAAAAKANTPTPKTAAAPVSTHVPSPTPVPSLYKKPILTFG